MTDKKDGKKNRILIVEDERPLCLLYVEELSREGYDVSCAFDADTALELLKSGDFDLIITDIRMPGKDGIELIGEIMGVRGEIPMIINTAYSSYKEDFMTWAADAYVVKSSSLKELKSRIGELLGE